ncbi:hypothetical protein T265_00489 [Opisthorchis viverrini]|uniref:Uncharacterized protein n=1 Tax=Opisthorchis viverrini TaxID=6198 RepID=A0A075A5L0_OPIVI|nr:hypothetical protein T265_00489 [Opisthorchis viverrini]KER33592.1 hypothetical protein T265_00489 [Opisthorchis viverrini]
MAHGAVCTFLQFKLTPYPHNKLSHNLKSGLKILIVADVRRLNPRRSVDGTEDSRSQGQVKIILEGLLGHIMTALPNDQCAKKKFGVVCRHLRQLKRTHGEYCKPEAQLDSVEPIVNTKISLNVRVESNFGSSGTQQ